MITHATLYYTNSSRGTPPQIIYLECNIVLSLKNGDGSLLLCHLYIHILQVVFIITTSLQNGAELNLPLRKAHYIVSALKQQMGFHVNRSSWTGNLR